jgi:hypothetical protein
MVDFVKKAADVGLYHEVVGSRPQDGAYVSDGVQDANARPVTVAAPEEVLLVDVFQDLRYSDLEQLVRNGRDDPR